MKKIGLSLWESSLEADFYYPLGTSVDLGVYEAGQKGYLKQFSRKWDDWYKWIGVNASVFNAA